MTESTTWEHSANTVGTWSGGEPTPPRFHVERSEACEALEPRWSSGPRTTGPEAPLVAAASGVLAQLRFHVEQSEALEGRAGEGRIVGLEANSLAEVPRGTEKPRRWPTPPLKKHGRPLAKPSADAIPSAELGAEVPRETSQLSVPRGNVNKTLEPTLAATRSKKRPRSWNAPRRLKPRWSSGPRTTGPEAPLVAAASGVLAQLRFHVEQSEALGRWSWERQTYDPRIAEQKSTPFFSSADVRDRWARGELTGRGSMWNGKAEAMAGRWPSLQQTRFRGGDLGARLRGRAFSGSSALNGGTGSSARTV